MTALGAGLVVGICIALLQHFTVIKLIAKAEIYERAAVHNTLHSNLDRPQTHDMHPPPAEEPGDQDGAGWEKFGLTVFTTTMLAIGYALLLTGAIAISGRGVSGREGILWGLAGFASFALAPSMGLPPELPGAVAAELLARQMWWVGCAIATAAGLALLVFGRRNWIVAISAGLLVLPHAIGAPQPTPGAHGLVPPELAAEFAARTLGIAAIFWTLLGWTAGHLYSRLGAGADA